VYLDIQEKISMVIECNGKVSFNEIFGSVKINTKLSGMPNVIIGLNDKNIKNVSSPAMNNNTNTNSNNNSNNNNNQPFKTSSTTAMNNDTKDNSTS